jgi:hypothetical protein
MKRALTMILLSGCLKVDPVDNPVQVIPPEETRMMHLVKLTRPYMDKSPIGLEYHRTGECFGYGRYECNGEHISIRLEGQGVQFDYVNFDHDGFNLGPCMETFWDRNANGELDLFIDYIGLDNSFDSSSCEALYGNLARRVIKQSHLSSFTSYMAVDALKENQLEARNKRFQELIEAEIEFLERTKHLNRE